MLKTKYLTLMFRVCKIAPVYSLCQKNKTVFLDILSYESISGFSHIKFLDWLCHPGGWNSEVDFIKEIIRIPSYPVHNCRDYESENAFSKSPAFLIESNTSGKGMFTRA